MKGDALLFMMFSWGVVLSLAVYCLTKLFSTGRQAGKKMPRDNG